jgi:hypothetical protein
MEKPDMFLLPQKGLCPLSSLQIQERKVSEKALLLIMIEWIILIIPVLICGFVACMRTT